MIPTRTQVRRSLNIEARAPLLALTIALLLACVVRRILRAVYWWEVLALFRRSIFVALDVILFNYPLYKYLSFVLAHGLVFSAHMYKMPFKVPTDNTLETISLFILLLLSLILMSYQYSQSFTLDAILFILTAGPTILFLSTIIITRTSRVANALINKSSTRERLSPLPPCSSCDLTCC